MTPTQTAIVIACITPFLLAQAVWIFLDARKRGEKYYWLWGLFGLTNVPQALLVYLIVTRAILGRNRGGNDDKQSKDRH